MIIDMKDYIVRFIRADDMPDEEYYYLTFDEAKKHYSLFLDDDSGLYQKIQIIDINDKLYEEMIFS